MKIGQQMLKFQKISNVQILILSTTVLIFCVKSIKIALIMHNWHIHQWMNQFWHTFKKKISQIVIGVEIDRWRRARYTSSGDSGMKSSLFRYIHVFGGFLVTWDNNLPISREKHYLNHKNVV